MKHTQAVFGYGSLANRQSLEATLGRPAGTLGLAQARGWRRDWSVAVNNLESKDRFEIHPTGEVPEHVLALNLTRTTQDLQLWPNGVMVGLDDEELRRLDARETHYDRVDITGDIIGKHGFERIFAYVGKPEYRCDPAGPAIVPASYVKTVHEGFEAAGGDAAEHFQLTTASTPADIVETVFVGQD